MSAPPSQPDLASAVQPHLHAGEQLLWTGRPPQGLAVWPCYSNTSLRGFVVVSAFLALSPILSVIDPGLRASAVPWICGGVGIVALYAALKGDEQWRANTVYALTDARALICNLDGRGPAESRAIPDETHIERERDGRATLHIGYVSHVAWIEGLPRYYPQRRIVFQAIDDFEQAYALARFGPTARNAQ